MLVSAAGCEGGDGSCTIHHTAAVGRIERCVREVASGDGLWKGRGSTTRTAGRGSLMRRERAIGGGERSVWWDFERCLASGAVSPRMRLTACVCVWSGGQYVCDLMCVGSIMESRDISTA